MNEETLGDVIRNRRLALGWTQEELAGQISDLGDEIRQSDISRLERNETSLPRRARLQSIAEVLDLPLGELLERSGWSGATGVFDDQVEEAPHPSRGAVAVPVREWPAYPVTKLDVHYESADGYRRLRRALDEAYDHQRRLMQNREKIKESESRFAKLVRRELC